MRNATHNTLFKNKSTLTVNNQNTLSIARSNISKRQASFKMQKDESTKSSNEKDENKQYPLEGLPPPREYENEDNQLRKYVQKKQELTHTLKKYKASAKTSRNNYTTAHNLKERVLTGVAMDSNGHMLKRKKINIENLPTDNPAPNLKLQSTKRQKIQ